MQMPAGPAPGLPPPAISLQPPVLPTIQGPAQMAQLAPDQMGGVPTGLQVLDDAQLQSMVDPASEPQGSPASPTDTAVPGDMSAVAPLQVMDDAQLNASVDQPVDSYWEAVRKLPRAIGVKAQIALRSAQYSFLDTLTGRSPEEQATYAGSVDAHFRALNSDPSLQSQNPEEQMPALATPGILQGLSGDHADTFVPGAPAPKPNEAQLALKMDVAKELASLEEIHKDAALHGGSPLSPKGIIYRLAESAPAILALPFVPNLAMGYIGTEAFSNQYVDSRLKRNRDPNQALADASVIGAAYMLPVNITLGQAFKVGKPLIDRAASTAAAGALQGGLSESLATAYRLGVFKDNISLRDAAVAIAAASIHGGASGAIIGGISHPLIEHADQVRRDKVSGYYNDAMDAVRSTDNGIGQAEYGKSSVGDIALARWDMLSTIERAAVDEVTKGNLKADDILPIQEKLQAERDILRSHILPRVKMDEGGQMTLPGFGVHKELNPVDVLPATAPNKGIHEGAIYHAEDEIAPVQANTPVLNMQTQKLFQQMGTGLAHANPLLNTYIEDWIGPANVHALKAGAQAASADPVYTKKLQGVLNKLFPKQDTILLFVGHGEGFSRLQKEGFSNATLDPLVAAKFAATKSATGDKKDALVSVIEVPKTSIKFVNHGLSFGHEYEVIYGPEGARYHGFYRPFGQKIKPVQDPNGGEFPPLLTLDQVTPSMVAKGQVNLPGFKPQQEHIPTERVQPDPEQLPLDFKSLQIQEALFDSHMAPVPEQVKVEDAPAGMKDAFDPNATFVEAKSAPHEQTPDEFGFIFGDKYNEQGILPDAPPGVHIPDLIEAREATPFEHNLINGLTETEHWKDKIDGGEQAWNKLLGIAKHVKDLFHLDDTTLTMTLMGLGPDKQGHIEMDDGWGQAHIALSPHATQEFMAETLLHELGHLVAFKHIDAAPDAVKQAMHQAFEQWMGEQPVNSTLQEQSQSLLLPAQHADLSESVASIKDAYDAQTINDSVFDNGMDGLREGVDYYKQYDEWIAQQIARWIQKPKNAQATGVVSKLFRGIANKLKAMYAYYDNHFPGLRESPVFGPHPYVNGFLDAIVKNNAVPFSSHSMQAKSADAKLLTIKQMDEMMRKVGGMASIAGKKLSGQMDVYGSMLRHGWTLLQIAKANPHMAGMARYKEAIDYWHNTRMKWIAEADTVIKDWRKLSKEQGDGLAKFLFDMTEMKYLPTGALPRWPTNAEMVSMLQQHGVNADTHTFYMTSIKPMFDKVLTTSEAVEIRDARRNISDPNVLAQRITEINTEYSRLRASPYFPLQRFGDFTIVVRDQAGHVKHVEAFETQGSRDRALARVRSQFPGDQIRADKFAEDVRIWRNMPPSLVQSLANKLNLTASQHGQLEELMFEFSPVRSFRRHFAKRETVGGYSQDAMRAFADYFFHGANHLARVEHGDEIASSIKEAQAGKADLARANVDVTKRQQIIDWMERHHKYIMEPKNEWAALRSFGFLWYLGFVPKAMLVNFTQIPFVAHPHLAAQFGQLEATHALGKASIELRRIYGKGGIAQSDPAFYKALQEGISQGWLDESMASDLAAVAEGGILDRFLPGNAGQIALRKASYAASYGFQQVERLNRRIVFRAAHELAMKQPTAEYLQNIKQENPRQHQDLRSRGWSEAEANAFLAAKDSIQSTQFEYAGYNRAELFRGKKSNLFLFKSYLQNMLWFFRHNPGGKQAVLYFLAAGGLMGLPLAEDLKEVIKAATDFDVEQKLRELMVALGGEHPDLLLHGAARYTFGIAHVAHLLGIPGVPEVDLSGSLGFGSVVPGVSEINRGASFADKATKIGTAIAGPEAAIAMNFLHALADDNPDNFKRWERAMPTQARNIARAFRFSQEGMEKTSTDAPVLSFDMTDPEQASEVAAQSLGFTPTRLAQKWDLMRAEQEKIEYFSTRRQMLMSQFDHVIQAGDLTARGDVTKAIRSYNAEIPDPRLAIRGKDLQKSVRERAKGRAAIAAGTSKEKMFRGIVAGVQKNYPEVTQEKVPSR